MRNFICTIWICRTFLSNVEMLKIGRRCVRLGRFEKLSPTSRYFKEINKYSRVIWFVRSCSVRALGRTVEVDCRTVISNCNIFLLTECTIECFEYRQTFRLKLKRFQIHQQVLSYQVFCFNNYPSLYYWKKTWIRWRNRSNFDIFLISYMFRICTLRVFSKLSNRCGCVV